MRHALVAGLVAVCASLGWLSSAAASTWAVSLAGTIGGTPIQVGFQVALADPAGSATVNVSGVPVGVSRTADAFGVAVNLLISSASCSTQVDISGAAPIQSTATGGLVATGPVTGTRTQTCSAGVVFTGPTPGGRQDPINLLLTAFVLTSMTQSVLEAVTGTVFFNTILGRQTTAPGQVVEAGTEIQTGSDGRATVSAPTGRRVTVTQNSRATLVAQPGTTDPGVNLPAGRVDVVSQGQTPGQTPGTVVTGTATVADKGTDFSVRYSQTGLVGSTVVTVRSGVVEVTNRRGQLTSLAAGQEATFEDSVPRVLLILPTDQGSIIAGRTNTFTWTPFPGAANYLVEFSISPAGFAQPNSPTVENPTLTLRVVAGAFTEGNGIVSFSFPVPTGVVPTGARVWFRVFPADGAGHVLPGATASDAVTVVVQ